ncbi:hypothetical protein [Eubacterium sp.]|uniref:hypothetical protein n=1 Tax=Eubacterium sp. TaxID=142586 RepID=UPI002FC5F478
MKLKNQQVVQYINNLESLGKMGLRLPGRIGYTIKQNKKKLIEAYTPYFMDLQAIEEKLGTIEYDEQVKELLEADVEVPIATTSPEPMFHLDLDPALFDLLDFMLEDDDGSQN